MTATFLAPYLKQRFVDANGIALYNGTVATYQAGTLVPLATYTDSTGLSNNTNPILLNPRGEADIWLLPNVAYKFLVSDLNGNLIWTIDNVINSILTTLYGGNDTGVVNAYVLNFNSNFTSLVNGIVLYFIAANTNTGPSTLNVNGLGVVSILNQNGSPLGSGQIVAGGVASVIYYNGNWLLTSPIGTIQQSGSFVGTFLGFTSVVTATVQYRIYNNIVFMFFNTTPPSGTSNTTSLSMNGLPSYLIPSANRFVFCCTVDNGNTEQFSGLLVSNAGACTFEKYSISTGNFSITGYTASGTKGLPSDWVVSYPLL